MKRYRLSRSIEEARRWVLDLSLHLRKHRLEHLSGRRLQQILGLLDVMVANAFPHQELGSSVSEHVAVVLDDIVLLRCEPRADIVQELFEDFLGDFGLSQRYFLDRLAVWGGLGSIVTDAASEVVLSAKDDKRSVVDGVDLLADDHHAHGLGHTHGDVIDE